MKTSYKPHRGSLNEKLSTLDVGERLYVETTLGKYATVMRSAVNVDRKPLSMQSFRFKCELVTGVVTASDIRHLVCVERTA